MVTISKNLAIKKFTRPLYSTQRLGILQTIIISTKEKSYSKPGVPNVLGAKKFNNLLIDNNYVYKNSYHIKIFTSVGAKCVKIELSIEFLFYMKNYWALNMLNQIKIFNLN